MNETLNNQIKRVKEKLDEVTENTTNPRKVLSEKIEKLMKLQGKYEDSWAGDWVNTPTVYHDNFDSSNRDRVYVDEDLIVKDLKRISKIDLETIREELIPLSQSFFDLRHFILSELSFIQDHELFKNEAVLLSEIENFKWGITQGDYVHSKRPQYAFIQNPAIINRGIETPPHIIIGGKILSAFSVIESYENFEKLARRLLRQLEIKATSSNEMESGSLFQQQALHAIIEKFHSVALQLRNRHAGRGTLLIEDEYDVQDLVNSLLRINFEDVRKEEYTPSYAGGASRIDFLLKREKILVEVKKTRSTLKDKEVGDQLIIDIARYKSHPDCKHLVCFVYDPENLILNPRGLEDDLNRNSSDEMLVEVFVRP